MNIGEANAWFAVVRALREPGQHPIDEAVDLLSRKAYNALHAGPRADEVLNVVGSAIETLAEFDDDLGLGDWVPPVETATVSEAYL